MDYLNDLAEEFEHLKRFEWAANQLVAPDRLATLAWANDRSYLLFALYLKARQLLYEGRYTEKSIGLQEADFVALDALLVRRALQVEKDPLLFAYLRTCQIVALDPLAEGVDQQIEDHIAYLQSFQVHLPLEDYVYNLSLLNNFCIKGKSLGAKGLTAATFRSALLMLEGKYGAKWSRKPHLPYIIFSNVATGAMDLAELGQWQFVPIYYKADEAPVNDVYDWLELYIKGYQSRVEKTFRASTVAYVRARMAFRRGDFVAAANAISKIDEAAVESLVLGSRRLTLMTWYALRYNGDETARRMARKFLADPRALLLKMRAQVRDLELRQKRLPGHRSHFLTFLDAFSALLQLRDALEDLPPESIRRSQQLHEGRQAAIAPLLAYPHESGEWLLAQFKALS
ncbi:hypothetical protein QWY85_04885 [Neolewinella lacunae]|uniref:Uncharacterized protein n=1 Tax=Neolewinella lacunae TaxID=1517758 RepID=A0A923TA27_9BACT|nr:hypothetical protein [Neolewinella lacunae]MBC6996131.1 hypothetical protein [Neolewinella lacunae]MDN3633984.1 hypothetical protein [Neolewinella lacunae]